MALGRATRGALRGCALALATLALGARPAHAEKTYQVSIESTPPGATVYLDSKDSEPLGQTPYKGQLEAGTYTLIIELDRYVDNVQDVTVKKVKKGVQKFKVPLSKAEEGEIKVVAAKGRADVKSAVVFIDGKEWGTLPDKLKVPAGPHQVEVKKEGFKTFEAWIEVGEGEVKTVKAELVAMPGGGGKGGGGSKGGGGQEAAASDGGNGDDGSGEDGEGSGDGGDDVASSDDDGDTDSEVEDEDDDDHTPTRAVARSLPFVSVGGGFELGGRRFRYANPTMGNLRPYDAGGVPLVRASIEVTPLAFMKTVLATGWTLWGTYAHATPLDSTAELNGMNVSVPTTWSELDAGLTYKYRFGAGSFVGPQVGYGIHSFNFSFNMDTDDLNGTIPDVQYKFVWLGLDGRYGFGGRFSALATGGTRLVNATGDIGTRFAKTDVIAFAFSAGVAATITRSIEARLVGRFDQFKHEFTPKTVSPDFVADGGTDRFFGVTLSAAFLY